ncbi:MAG TPA: VWA domain-containing protein [Candidatus Polarisedimenticolia bacterium]|nr:VWA domain-containing protein [Candidatus Polarisedimenticolia bacterium]
MRFGAQVYLWALLLVPVLAGLLALSAWRRRRDLARFGDMLLVRRLAASLSVERRLIKAVLLVMASIFLVLALARPQWGARMETVSRRGIDLVIAVDTSNSMLAEDISPNRLAQARGAVLSLLEMLEGDRVGLVAFAGTAYLACPLTLDYGAAGMFVDVLDTDLLPVQGTAIAEAITVATKAFPEGERRYKVIILITDGEDHEGDVEAAATAAADQGIVIHTVGVGGTAGTPIPIRNARGDVTGYKEDQERRKVTSRLNQSALESIAVATRGKYFRASAEGIELRRVYEEIAAMDRRTLSSRMTSAFEERYIIPLGAAIVLLAIEASIGDRRRTARAARAAGGSRPGARAAAAALCALLGAMFATPASAADVASRNNEGNQKYEQKKYDEALRLYTDAQALKPSAPELHYNIGNVLFRKGEFDKAIEEYLRAQSAASPGLRQAAVYNQGNAHLQQGKLQDAVNAYVQALRLDPKDQEAKRNLELALRLLEEQKKQQQQQQQQQQPQDKKDQEQKQQEPKPAKPEEPKPDEKKEEQEKRPGQMSEEEARQILQALRENEKEGVRKHAKMQPPSRPRHPEEDW